MTITVPSPTESGTLSITVAYQNYTGFVFSITDANGNVTTFIPCNSSGVASTSGAPGSGILNSGYVLLTRR